MAYGFLSLLSYPKGKTYQTVGKRQKVEAVV